MKQEPEKKMTQTTLAKIVAILDQKIKEWPVPVVGIIANEAIDKPFEVLISTILSLRTKDKTTLEASLRLFKVARTPKAILNLDLKKLQDLIYPVSFFRNKAVSIQKTCSILLDKFQGKVPNNMDDLVALPGVGRKTANLVITLGFNDYGICVDTHVHRISNRWGLIKTKDADESELVLRKILPKKYWIKYNDWLVAFGQNLCQPVSPHCSLCPVEKYCPKIDVVHSR